MTRRRAPVAAPVVPAACAKHTPCPSGYIAWHEWAEEMAKTHRQVRCKGCGLYAVWVPR